MTDKQKYALEKVLSALPDECKESYSEVAKYAIELGYMPVLKGVRKDYAEFTSSKLKKTILKINTNPEYRCIAMRFFAVTDYSAVLQDAINERLAYWNVLGHEAKCFGCGNCDGTQGYRCTLPDGKEGFLCGYGLLPIPTFKAENIGEVKEALKTQDAFFRKQATV